SRRTAVASGKLECAPTHRARGRAVSSGDGLSASRDECPAHLSKIRESHAANRRVNYKSGCDSTKVAATETEENATGLSCAIRKRARLLKNQNKASLPNAHG